MGSPSRARQSCWCYQPHVWCGRAIYDVFKVWGNVSTRILQNSGYVTKNASGMPEGPLCHLLTHFLFSFWVLFFVFFFFFETLVFVPQKCCRVSIWLISKRVCFLTLQTRFESAVLQKFPWEGSNFREQVTLRPFAGWGARHWLMMSDSNKIVTSATKSWIARSRLHRSQFLQVTWPSKISKFTILPKDLAEVLRYTADWGKRTA